MVHQPWLLSWKYRLVFTYTIYTAKTTRNKKYKNKNYIFIMRRQTKEITQEMNNISLYILYTIQIEYLSDKINLTLVRLYYLRLIHISYSFDNKPKRKKKEIEHTKKKNHHHQTSCRRTSGRLTINHLHVQHKVK